MFGKRKREQQRERGRRVGRDVAAYMDEREAYSWGWRTMRDEIGEETASERYPRVGVVEIVERLMAICDDDVNDVMAALEVWKDSREERFEQQGDEDRAMHVIGTYMSIGLTGIGNLFGFIPSDALSFDAELAAAGRERGWRLS